MTPTPQETAKRIVENLSKIMPDKTRADIVKLSIFVCDEIISIKEKHTCPECGGYSDNCPDYGQVKKCIKLICG